MFIIEFIFTKIFYTIDSLFVVVNAMSNVINRVKNCEAICHEFYFLRAYVHMYEYISIKESKDL